MVKKYSLDINLPYLVFAVPQYFEQGNGYWCHWQLIEAYIKEITNLEVNLLLSLHPRMIYEDYEFLQKYNCKYSRSKLCNFIGCVIYF